MPLRLAGAKTERPPPLTALFDLGHPAHFHLFKNTIRALRQEGHRVLIVARQKDCLPLLLDRAGWPYYLVRRKGRGLAILAADQFKALNRILWLSLRHRIDVMLGTSVVIGPAARLTGAASLVFCEDDADVVPLFAQFAYAPAHYVVTPRSLRREDHGLKHLTYPGYHELAYLHPDLYRPDPGIFDLLGVEPGQPYFVVRLVAYRAHHDIGQRGISAEQARLIIRRLLPHGRVFISAEGPLPEDLQPYLLPTPVDRIFDVLGFARMVIGDSQTMTVEAAVLGTPALRCNTFVGRLSVLEELEHRYGLTVGFHPSQFDRLLARMDAWLSEPDLKAQWQRRRLAMLGETVNLTAWTLDLIADVARRRQQYGVPIRPVVPTRLRTARRRPHGIEPFEHEAAQEKYATQNPLEQWIIRRFFRHVEAVIRQSRGTILDVGAGEGDPYRFLAPDIQRRGIVGIEVDGACFARLRHTVPALLPVQASIYAIPFADASFETVLSMEVLEHLDDPQRGLRELLRVCRGHLILSVPLEPIWRIGNMMRGAHLRHLGNTPGHVQHWGKRGFVAWVSRHADVEQVRTPLPWTIVLARPRHGSLPREALAPAAPAAAEPRAYARGHPLPREALEVAAPPPPALPSYPVT